MYSVWVKGEMKPRKEGLKWPDAIAHARHVYSAHNVTIYVREGYDGRLNYCLHKTRRR